MVCSCHLGFFVLYYGLIVNMFFFFCVVFDNIIIMLIANQKAMFALHFANLEKKKVGNK